MRRNKSNKLDPLKQAIDLISKYDSSRNTTEDTINTRLADIKRSLSAEVATSTDIMLERASKFDSLVLGLHKLLSQYLDTDQKPATSQEPEYPRIIIGDVPKIEQAKSKEDAAPSKGLEALAPLLAPSATALAFATNKSLPPEERVLRFLDALGRASSIGEMKDVGLTGRDNGALGNLLHGLEKDGLLVFDYSAKRYDLTDKAEAHLDELDAKVAEPAKPKPELRVIENKPRILETTAIEKLEQHSVKDRLILQLYKAGGALSLNEMRELKVKGYGQKNNIATLIGFVKDDGHIISNFGKWHLTEDGKARARGLVSGSIVPWFTKQPKTKIAL